MQKHGCDTCRMRARYDNNPRSILGRIWKWHIRFCPGWKAYLKALTSEERGELEKKYFLGGKDRARP